LKNIRWGILGLGNIAKTFADSTCTVKNASVFALASKRLRNIIQFKEEYNISSKFCFSNYADLLRCEEIDAVYIALPNHLHAEWISRCIDFKKHILVEKPAVIFPDQLELFQDKLIQQNLIFSEAFMYLHHPRMQMLLASIKDGMIGKPLGMRSSFGFEAFLKPSPLQRLLNCHKSKPLHLSKSHGGGCILDLGCYLTSFATILSKYTNGGAKPSFSFQNMDTTFDKQEVEVDASTTIKFENGFTSEIRCSFTEHLDQSTKIWGENGEISLEDTWSCQSDGFWHETKYFESRSHPLFDNPYSFQVHNLSELILRKKQGKDVHPFFGVQDSLDNSKIIDSWRSATNV
jgi:predicted dehydrogenase